MEFVSIDKWTLIFTWGNLLILYLLMKKFLFGPIQRVLNERKDAINNDFKAAENAKNEAENMKALYEEKLKNAKEKADEIILNATKNAHDKEEEIISGAKNEAQHIISKANKDAEQKKKAAVEDAKNEMSDMAVLIASKVIEKDIDKKDHEKLINEFINEIGDAS